MVANEKQGYWINIERIVRWIEREIWKVQGGNNGFYNSMFNSLIDENLVKTVEVMNKGKSKVIFKKISFSEWNHILLLDN